MGQAVNANALLARKLLIAFLVGFLPPFALGLIGLLNNVIDALSTGGTIDFSILAALALSVLSGALATGVRAAFALIPGLNLTPTDKLHSLGRSKGDSVTVVDPPA